MSLITRLVGHGGRNSLEIITVLGEQLQENGCQADRITNWEIWGVNDVQNLPLSSSAHVDVLPGFFLTTESDGSPGFSSTLLSFASGLRSDVDKASSTASIDSTTSASALLLRVLRVRFAGRSSS